MDASESCLPPRPPDPSSRTISPLRRAFFFREVADALSPDGAGGTNLLRCNCKNERGPKPSSTLSISRCKQRPTSKRSGGSATTARKVTTQLYGPIHKQLSHNCHRLRRIAPGDSREG